MVTYLYYLFSCNEQLCFLLYIYIYIYIYMYIYILFLLVDAKD